MDDREASPPGDGRAAPAAATPASPAPVIPAPATSTRGENVIDGKAVEKIIVAAIDSVPGTVAAGGAINRMAGRGYPRVDAQIAPHGRAVSVETDIAVSWPSPVRDIAHAVRDTIIAWVADATGMPVVRCDVRVATVVGADGDRPWARVAAGDVAAHPRRPSLVSPSAAPLPARPVTVPPAKELRPIKAPRSGRDVR